MDERPTYEQLEQRVRQLEEELELSRTSANRRDEDKYRRLFELESDALFLIDSTDGRILEANRAAAEVYGRG